MIQKLLTALLAYSLLLFTALPAFSSPSASVSQEQREAFNQAVRSFNLKAISQLLGEGADINAPLEGDQYTPLTYSIKGYLETPSGTKQDLFLKLFEFLLDKGARPDFKLEARNSPIQVILLTAEETLWSSLSKFYTETELLTMLGWDPSHLVQTPEKIGLLLPPGYVQYTQNGLEGFLALMDQPQQALSRTLFFVPLEDIKKSAPEISSVMAFCFAPEEGSSNRLLPKFIHGALYSWSFRGSFFETGFPEPPHTWGKRVPEYSEAAMLTLCQGELPSGDRFLLAHYCVDEEAKLPVANLSIQVWSVGLKAVNRGQNTK